jgi:hypothetical protein
MRFVLRRKLGSQYFGAKLLDFALCHEHKCLNRQRGRARDARKTRPSFGQFCALSS